MRPGDATTPGPGLAVAIAVVAGASLLLPSGPTRAQKAPPADPESDPAMGHDHSWHDGKVAVSGQPPVPCARCHPVDRRGLLSGRPDHRSCFGSCHGAVPQLWRRARPQAVADEVRRVCITCHTPAAIAQLVAGTGNRPTVTYPPYNDPEHGLAMSHRTHASANQTATGSACLGCHRLPPAPPPKKPPPGSIGTGGTGSKPAVPRSGRKPITHARCVTCHARPGAPRGQDPGQDAAPDQGSMPAMTECSRCHVSEVGPRSRPFVRRGVYPVRATFSHPSHRGASDCTICHGALAATDGNELPSPSMEVCGTCHDGDKAFSIVTPDCTRCHETPEFDPGHRPHAGSRYDHARHATRGSYLQCTTCHRLDRRGTPLPPSMDHAPCSDSGCHRDDFSATRPTVCGACHIGTEPWRKLYFTRPPRTDTEFGARFSHASHLGSCQADDPTCAGSCERCHQASQQMSLARDHDACMGSGCHGSDGGAAPTLAQCAECHRQGLSAARRAERLRGEWSVRARFRHEPHRSDPRGKPGTALPCTTCHTGIERATGMDDLPVPTKATCLPCHDGTTAFKVTGHGCTRCHVAAGER